MLPTFTQWMEKNHPQISESDAWRTLASLGIGTGVGALGALGGSLVGGLPGGIAGALAGMTLGKNSAMKNLPDRGRLGFGLMNKKMKKK